jgi:hypothetical protein
MQGNNHHRPRRERALAANSAPEKAGSGVSRRQIVTAALNDLDDPPTDANSLWILSNST